MIFFSLEKLRTAFKGILIFVLYYCFLLLISGCVATEFESSVSTQIQTENVNLVWPPPPQTPRIRYLKTITKPSESGKRKSSFFNFLFGKEEPKGGLLRPYGVFADAGRVYVTDPGLSLVHVIDAKGKKYFQIDKAKDDDLISPIGIAVDKNGDIYISDSMLKKVFVFNRDGEYIREIGSSGIFVRPAGIAVDEDRIYVIDTHTHKIMIFSKKEGKIISEFGRNGTGEGEFNYPTNIFVGKDRKLYITDSLNFRVQIFDRSGNFISFFGKHGDGIGDFSKPKGIAVDSEGHVYVADALFDNVQIFDKDGNLLLTFGNTGRQSGEFVLPAGIFIDEHDRIYVADSYNSRIQIFQYLKEKNAP